MQLARRNSDAAQPPLPTSVTASDGSTVRVDDYVYMVPEQDDPYHIGRIMAFVYVPRVRQPRPLLSSVAAQRQLTDQEDTPTPSPTPTAASSSGGGGSGSSRLCVRVAWFQRGSEVLTTRVRAKETRLLVATMHTDINPVGAIRARCYVRHEAEIEDMGAWKSRPDHYYYSQLFDRYSTRFYDIVPVSHIRNAPQEVLQKLRDTYEFIFAEPQKISDLTSTRRACTVCAKWCSISESVKCTLCDRHYHLQCLDPPPTRKPAKGYGWQCAACMRRIQDQRAKSAEDAAADLALSAAAAAATAVAGAADPDSGELHKRITRNNNRAVADETHGARRSLSGTGVPNTPGQIGGGGASSDTESRQGSKRLKISHGDSGRLDVDAHPAPIPRPRNRGLWPFRYFGINTEIEDVLNDDERIYPRAVSRIGPKYQAIVPDMVSPAGPDLDRELAAKAAEVEKINSTNTGAAAKKLIAKVLHSHSSGAVSGTGTGIGTGGGGGGGTARWHGKSSEQMDRMWDEIEVRRGCRDEQLFFRQPAALPSEELDMYMEAIVPFLKRHYAAVRDFTLLDCQDTALHGLALHAYDVEEALISIPECPEGYARQRDPGDYWTPAGLERFNGCLREYGSNLQAIHEGVPEFTRRAVTLRYYLVRHTEAGERLLAAHAERNLAGHRRANLGQADTAVNAHMDSDVGASMSGTPASSPGLLGALDREFPRGAASERIAPRCVNCATSRAARWFPASADQAFYNTRSNKASTANRVICGECRSFWLRYGVMADQDAIGLRKSQPLELPLPVPSLSSSSSLAAPHPPQPLPPALPQLHPRSDAARDSVPRDQIAIPRPAVKQRPPEAWVLRPCDVCQQPTDAGPDLAVLACRDCGLCVHYGCSGYPSSAPINPRRWKCGVCVNVTNPTVSINYMCVLCRAEPPPHQAGQPRQMMWRTTGNNWVHPLCALVARETVLRYSHGNIIVGGTKDIPASSWQRPCTACTRTDGVAHACAAAGCAEGAHGSCALGAPAAPGLQRAAALVIRASGGTGQQGLLSSAAKFVAAGGQAEVVVKCARHMGATQDIGLRALDSTGQPVVAAAIVAKHNAAAAGLGARGATLRSTVPISPQSSQQSAAAPPPPPPQPQPQPQPQPPAATNGGATATGQAPRANIVEWGSPAMDPVCSRCQIDFSPIWWPAPGQAPGASVLCHRCYAAGASAANPQRDIASS
ncbi:putative PHD type zinc finger protein with BAH domain-containing protein [Coemansia javaensis]|uniref:PHD type zinc finger protein with BAH domain-containing protein n=1 Tax=Coemansia javaensis TaxID=2761396 RepID=A0A9W8LIL8_9FUNG|nr:putative PHD type zinc finger protein with BAH domain-containing protein [Coemansia javaensis]